MESPKIVFIIGRPGSGKGTQIDILLQKTDFEVIKTGEMLRERAKQDDFIGKIIDENLSQGKLMPTPFAFLLWMPRLVECRQNGAKGVFFDGNPRKFYEAKMLEELFVAFDWKDVFLIHIDISEDEARKRLLKRGRSDDNKEDIEERLRWFKDEVEPVVDYYKEKGSVIKVDGERDIKEIAEEIEEKTKNIIF